jgi:predicted secreted protein
MKWTSILAIYLLFWVMSAFFVLPFHGRRADQQTSDVAGTDHGAPATFRVGPILKQTTMVATISFALYYVAYTQNWVDADAISSAFMGRDAS